MQAKSKSTKEPKQSLKIFKFEKIGQSISGKVTGFYQGQYSPVLQIGKIIVGLQQIVLLKLVKQALKDKTLRLGVNVTIKYVKKSNRTKIFTLKVGNKTYESSVGFQPLKFENLEKSIDTALENAKQK